MAYRRTPLVVGEWFHCYTRTIDHSRPFENMDYLNRFLETLYVANQQAPMPALPHLLKQYAHREIFSLTRHEPLVMIAAYCIMPTHYHLLLQPTIDDGISLFMHKLGTGFTRHYNEQEYRIGNLFVKPFRSRHVANDRYFRRVIQYIHLNPLEISEPQWKEGRALQKRKALQALRAYEASSLPDYEGVVRPERRLLHEPTVTFARSIVPEIDSVVNDAIRYYQEMATSS